MKDLIVPVYLNQRLVFDLLAMLQGGISTVTSITKSDAAEKSSQEKISTTFGLSQALSSLLKIDLSGGKENSRNSSEEQTITQERIHTPASLFYELRIILQDNKILKNISDESTPHPGDIVEFEAYLNKNPIIETMDSMIEIMDMVIVFESDNGNSNSKNPKTTKTQPNENQKIKSQMMAFSEKLKSGGTIDLIAKNTKNRHAAVITIESSFLSDLTMSDLVEGKFKVLGKVIRSLESPDESISLLRKTALSKMPTEAVMGALYHLRLLQESQGFVLPNLETEIFGPAIQIIPIAIYA